MNHELPRDTTIRLRSDDATPLDALSSVRREEAPARRSGMARLARGFAIAGGVAVAVVAALVATVYLAGIAGIGSDRLRREAEAAISAFAGAPVVVASGPARLSLDGSRFLGLEVPAMRLADAETGEEFIEAGSLRFGLRLWPLLSGEVQLRSVRLADARIVPGAAPDRGGRGWSAGIRNEHGLLDPDKALENVFAGVHRLFEFFEMRSTRRIELDNVELALGSEHAEAGLLIDRATLSRDADGALNFAASVTLADRQIEVEGVAQRDGREQRIASLEMRATSSAVAGGDLPAPDADRVGRLPEIRGVFDVVVSGVEAPAGEASRIAATIRTIDGALQFRGGETLSGSAELRALLVAGSGKVEIERLVASTGRSRFAFHGAVGPAPYGGGADEIPAYRYELVSDGSTIATADAPEPALDVLARIAGAYLPVERRLNADEIGLRTRLGEALGTASVDFAEDRTPSVVLAIDVPSMPVAHVKQLWPWAAAKGARNWVLANAFGGTVENSRIRLSVGPGRLGNGIPLAANEIAGHFEVRDTRFDVLGEIPPVRDAHGVIDFRGTDIDIALSSGTVFMPSGRTVAARDGTFRIRNAHVKPVVGELDLDVEGAAPAVAELASYKPIAALRSLDLRPQDFQGEVSGNVKAQIPLAHDIPLDRLDWKVALEYSGLSLARPMEGHMVTDAEGSIEIEPTVATIEAAAMLDGMPADLKLVEPIGGSAVERRRDISITLDDQGREALTPGLIGLVEGPVLVDLEVREEERWITADLTKAVLKLPFAGWTKGAGVPATVSFGLAAEEDSMRLSDFRLDGNTFGASGEIVLQGGELTEARFDSVRLNRDDRVAVTVRRADGGYAVGIEGGALDARPLIKRITADSGGSGPAGKAAPLSVQADVKSVTGFDGEVLSNVKIDFRGVGSTIANLAVSAVSRSGGAISIVSTDEKKDRSVQMQSADAGALLRFLNIYAHMEGGAIRLTLDSRGGGPLRGQIEARDFWLVDEPRLGSIVSTAPSGDGRTFTQAAGGEIDASRVRFDRGFAQVEKGDGYLTIANGVLRGPLIGATFEGTVFDPDGNMSVTGTFMPAYGVNRLFAEIPLIGQILGNGSDRGLIGITYKLAGDSKSPKLQVNPLSAVAPGIFRQIFEFN